MKVTIRRSRSESALTTTVLLLTVATLLVPVGSPAQNTGQETFESAEQAVNALITANRNNDIPSLNQILGPDASSLISSGDETQDQKDRANFVALYDAHHRLVSAGPGKLTLMVGKNEWPLPIPLVKSNGKWISLIPLRARNSYSIGGLVPTNSQPSRLFKRWFRHKRTTRQPVTTVMRLAHMPSDSEASRGQRTVCIGKWLKASLRVRLGRLLRTPMPRVMTRARATPITAITSAF